MQRIEAGTLRGRKLLALPSGVPGLRPMGARIRGAIFDRLQHEVHDTRVLDLFAGSGALSLEALSRGARLCTVLEKDLRVIRHLGRQLEVLDLSSRAELHHTDALEWIRAGRGMSAPYDLVFVDPPFAMPEVFEPVARGLCEGGFLAAGAQVICERERSRGKSPTVAWPPALTLEFCRDYGQARVEILRLRDDT